jgi:glycosyltransferase involved in cell wall biosynthesis
VSGNSESTRPVGLSILILTHNEALNIADCLWSVAWADEVFVVDSLSSDRTVDIARQHGARIHAHAFEGYARQRNWALENLPFSHEWVLVLDADERVPPALAEEIGRALEYNPHDYAGFYLDRRLFFLGRWLKRGGLHPSWILRLFKREAGQFEDRPLNEHVVLRGPAGYLKHPLDHKDSHPLNDWIAKHCRYADLEAGEYFAERSGRFADSFVPHLFENPVGRKRWIKLYVWNRLPLIVRPFLLFFRNYVLQGGILEGKPGLIYHVLWSFWYPFLVDAKIVEKQSTRSSPQTSCSFSAATIQSYTPRE